VQDLEAHEAEVGEGDTVDEGVDGVVGHDEGSTPT
jgi:hypothetical protein